MPEYETPQSLQTLPEHQNILQHVLTTALERVLIVSPFISISTIELENISSFVSQAVARGVNVQIFVDSDKNCYNDGTMKDSALNGIAELAVAGAQVAVVNGTNSKTLARDNDLIAVGCFNWLSAVGFRNGTCQLKEKTLMHTGEDASKMISKELAMIEEAGYGLTTFNEDSGIEVTRAGKIFALLFILVIPTLIANDIGNKNVGIACTAFMLAVSAICYWKKVSPYRRETSTQQI